MVFLPLYVLPRLHFSYERKLLGYLTSDDWVLLLRLSRALLRVKGSGTLPIGHQPASSNEPGRFPFFPPFALVMVTYVGGPLLLFSSLVVYAP